MEEKNLLKEFLKSELSGIKYTSGDIIKLHRNALGFSIDQLVLLTQIHKEDLLRYESSELVPTKDIAMIIASALAIHHDSILYPNSY